MWIVSWLLQKTFQINLLVAFTSMRKLQWQLVLFFWIVWLQGLTICSPIRFRFLIIIMGSFGRAEPLTCKRCGRSSIVVDDTFVCEACVSEECFLVCLQKQHIYIYISFFVFSTASYCLPIHKIAKQSCDASFGVGGDCDRSFAKQLYYDCSFLFTFAYWQDALSVRDHAPHRSLLPTLWTADCL